MKQIEELTTLVRVTPKKLQTLKIEKNVKRTAKLNRTY
jgi:hypothetical protein